MPVFVVEARERTDQLPNGGTATVRGDYEVPGLSLRNFRIFEDGTEQRLKSLAWEGLPIRAVEDNHFRHPESFCTPRGIWISQDITPDLLNVLWNADPGQHLALASSAGDLPPSVCEGWSASGSCNFGYHYLLSYEPPPSAEGSCHRIKVKLAHINAKAFSRDEYCNVKHPASDPLLGTELGNQLATDLDSSRMGSLPLTAQAAWVFGDLEKFMLYVAVELPWKDFDNHWRVSRWRVDLSVLGLLYRSDGAVATRFSDTACYSSGKLTGSTLKLTASSAVKEALKYEIPSRYLTQLDLTSGSYILKLAVTDEKNSWHTEIPVQIDSLSQDRLAMSSLVLCKRFRRPDQAELGVTPVSKYVPLLSKGIEFTPTGDTHFQTSDAMAAYFEVYEPLLGKMAAPGVRFQMSVANAKTGELKTDTGLRPADSFIQPGKTIIPIAEQIAIDELPKGEYRLEVQASDSAGNHTEWRSTSFTIE